jgi:hypothetical protein
MTKIETPLIKAGHYQDALQNGSQFEKEEFSNEETQNALFESSFGFASGSCSASPSDLLINVYRIGSMQRVQKLQIL